MRSIRFPLVAVPVFIFVGNLMNQSGITEVIYRFATTLVGRVHGGLAQVNIVGSLIFSGMSGAALADIGGLGRIEVKAMASHGFKREFAGALTCASAIVGPIFPPSIPLIIYGSATNVSIIQLLLAGIVPALICVALLMVTVAFLAWKRNFPRAARWPTLARALGRLPARACRRLMTPVLLVSGMLLGFFTPTEAASITVAYVIFISAVIYRTLTWQHLVHSAFETLKSTSAILIIVAAAALFGWIMAIEQIPQTVAKQLLSLSTDPLMLLLIVNVILLIAGHVPRFDDGDAPHHPDHRRAAASCRRRPGPSRHRRDLQPDARAPHAADGARALPHHRHRPGLDARGAARAAALLHPARRDARHHHALPGAVALDPEDDPVGQDHSFPVSPALRSGHAALARRATGFPPPREGIAVAPNPPGGPRAKVFALSKSGERDAGDQLTFGFVPVSRRPRAVLRPAVKPTSPASTTALCTLSA